jgi:site-specific recombinase XerD
MSIEAGAVSGAPESFPDASSLAALRAWFEGLPARECVTRYLGNTKLDGQSSRGILGAIRRRLATLARQLQRPDLAAMFEHAEADRSLVAAQVSSAIEELRVLRMRQPQLDDNVDQWFSPRIAKALHEHGIQTLAQLTVRVPRRRMWWVGVDGLGRSSARKVEELFARHPSLTARARALVEVTSNRVVVPWEQFSSPLDLDGSSGRYRAPPQTCTLDAKNDYDAVSAWLALHEAPATQRSYRKEAERLILWITLERDKPLSSMNIEDATAYRAFLRRPTPHLRWVGTPAPRMSPEWRPFAGALSAQSIAYALSVLGAMFRWLVEQRYVLANPFSGIKVRGGSRAAPLDSGRSFTDAEWSLIRIVADGLEWSYGWAEPSAQRLRFLLDFCYGTGLRAGELVDATLGSMSQDTSGDWWLHVVGKGSKPGKVSLPPLARDALDWYLVQRGLPTTPTKWRSDTSLVGGLADDDATGGISQARLWSIIKRFFQASADVVQESNPKLAEKLRVASTHWMRHTHATHALERGAELTTVRDNLRHASLATTSTYLHGNEIKRARQMRDAFGSRH